MSVPHISLPWAWFGLAVLALVAVARITRYRVVSVNATSPVVLEVTRDRVVPASVVIWDRWRHRVCAVRHIGELTCDWTALDSVGLEIADVATALADAEAQFRTLKLRHRLDSLTSVRDCLAAVVQGRPDLNGRDCYRPEWPDRLRRVSP